MHWTGRMIAAASDARRIPRSEDLGELISELGEVEWLGKRLRRHRSRNTNRARAMWSRLFAWVH